MKQILWKKDERNLNVCFWFEYDFVGEYSNASRHRSILNICFVYLFITVDKTKRFSTPPNPNLELQA